MKAITDELESDLAENATFLCRLWTVTRKGGFAYRFTDLDRDVPYNGNLYKSSNSFDATAIQTVINSAAADLDVNLLLGPDAINYQDLARGMFDNAPVSLHIINYLNPDHGAIHIFEGTITTVDLPTTQMALLRLAGSMAKATRNFTEKYSATCRAVFGDERCKVDVEGLYSEPFTVSSVVAEQHFTTDDLAGDPAKRYALGTIKWLTGKNAGTAVEVGTSNGSAVKTMFRSPYQIEVGDTGRIYRGCPRTLNACIGYDNKPNYRGEPFVPGEDGIKA